MKGILAAIAELLKIKNIVILIIVFSIIYFVSVGKIGTAIISTTFTSIVAWVFTRDD